MSSATACRAGESAVTPPSNTRSGKVLIESGMAKNRRHDGGMGSSTPTRERSMVRPCLSERERDAQKIRDAFYLGGAA